MAVITRMGAEGKGGGSSIPRKTRRPRHNGALGAERNPCKAECVRGALRCASLCFALLSPRNSEFEPHYQAAHGGRGERNENLAGRHDDISKQLRIADPPRQFVCSCPMCGSRPSGYRGYRGYLGRRPRYPRAEGSRRGPREHPGGPSVIPRRQLPPGNFSSFDSVRRTVPFLGAGRAERIAGPAGAAGAATPYHPPLRAPPAPICAGRRGPPGAASHLHLHPPDPIARARPAPGWGARRRAAGKGGERVHGSP